MKKIKWLAIVILLLLAGVVKAATNDTTVRIDYYSDVYGNFLIGQDYYWNQMGITYANHNLAYCLEPGKWITESTYDSYTDFNVKNFSEELKKKLELIAFYGYEYKGHQTRNYYLATQELIWRELGIQDMYWSTGAVHGGDRINVDHEIETIYNLMNSHHNMPAFNNQTFEMRSGEQLCTEDANGVFSNYEVLPPSGHGTTLAGNTLCINASAVGDTTISFLRNPEAYRVSLLYTKNNSQAIATFGLSSKIIAKVNVKVTGYTLELHKKDFDTKTNIPSGGASLKGAIYQVTDGLYIDEEIVTKEDGTATINNLPAGSYDVKEVQASLGYQLDPNTYSIHVGMDTSLEVGLDVYEKVIRGEVELIKVMSNGSTGVMEPERNVTFGIYTKNNELIEEVTTNEHGSVKVSLPYGTYIVRQLTTTPNYERVEDFEIVVTGDTTEAVRYVMNDAPVQAKVKIKKVDEFGKPIKQKGIVFKIINLNTGEYVRQKLDYPEEIVVDEFVTNEYGEVTTPYPLEAGEYALEEIVAPTGYLKPGGNVSFILNENTETEKTEQGKLFTVTVTNYVPKGNITIMKYGRIMELVKNEFGEYDTLLKEELLSGVKFGLYAGSDIIVNGNKVYETGELIESLVTEAGVARSMELPLGTYCVKELESLPDFEIDNTSKCITLEYKDMNTSLVEGTLKFINEQNKKRVLIKKYGEEMSGVKQGEGVYEKVPLAGVIFSVIADETISNGSEDILENTVIYERATDENGEILLEALPVGNYVIHEKETPKYYKKTDDIKLAITREDTFKKVEITNERKKGNVVVLKVDSETEKPLDGAKFRLFSKDKKVLLYQIEAKDGIINLKNIAFEHYYLEETKAPSGYLKERGEKLIQVKEEEMKPILFLNHKSILPNTSSINRYLYMIGGALTILSVLAFLVSFYLKNRYGK